ncbi:DUF116 domain-containing protein [Paenibacillus puldeungensis]|uniref:DUF116 domain-containing protein n=1 Tax=Paenibacillus puldeungensis TaxID=696536 RepID=A0ABW3S488_9BACL
MNPMTPRASMTPEVITYALPENASGSDAFYHDVSQLADELLETTKGEKAVSDFVSFTAEHELELMSNQVYVLEFLMIGVLWRSYGKQAAAFHLRGTSLLTRIYRLRSKGKQQREAVNRVKGFLNTTVLAKAGTTELNIHPDHFGKLIRWLAATGEFEEECKRLNIWKAYLLSKPLNESISFLERAIRLTDWFERRSVIVLGCYTPNVDSFREHHAQSLKWKENLIFCTRGRVEYHLNMVGAELMNRAFRDCFLQTKEKKVLLPICMRLRGEIGCRAVRVEDGYACTGCVKECQVNQMTVLGKEKQFQVRIIPHASTAFEQLDDRRKGEIGIIGIACVLQLISGGYKAKSLGFEPQCVLLNYCGCARHWHPDGIVTHINLNRLKSLLES